MVMYYSVDNMANNLQETTDTSLGKKKSIFVMVTVVGCIAILWPKIISPMFATIPQQQPADSYGKPGNY